MSQRLTFQANTNPHTAVAVATTVQHLIPGPVLMHKVLPRKCCSFCAWIAVHQLPTLPIACEYKLLHDRQSLYAGPQARARWSTRRQQLPCRQCCCTRPSVHSTALSCKEKNMLTQDNRTMCLLAVVFMFVEIVERKQQQKGQIDSRYK